jgi:hypothetical protein
MSHPEVPPEAGPRRTHSDLPTYGVLAQSRPWSCLHLPPQLGQTVEDRKDVICLGRGHRKVHPEHAEIAEALQHIRIPRSAAESQQQRARIAAGSCAIGGSAAESLADCRSGRRGPVGTRPSPQRIARCAQLDRQTRSDARGHENTTALAEGDTACSGPRRNMRQLGRGQRRSPSNLLAAGIDKPKD